MTPADDRSPGNRPPLLVPSPALIAAARLRVTINDRRGISTDPEIRALATSDPGVWPKPSG